MSATCLRPRTLVQGAHWQIRTPPRVGMTRLPQRRSGAGVGTSRQYVRMGGMAIAWVGAAALALLTGWLGYLFGARQEREKERRSRDFTAATDLVTPLRELQRLLRWFGREEIT